MKLAFGKSIERTLGIISVSIAGYICFIVIDMTGQGTGLSTAKIFATMELLVTMKLVVFFMGVSLGFYYELLIIF